MPSVLLNIDAPDFTIVAVNNAFINLTSVSNKEVAGLPFFEAFPMNLDDDGTRIQKIKYAFDYVIAEQKPFQIEKHRYDMAFGADHSSGQCYWKIDTYPLFDNEGNLTHIVQSSVDITSIHLVEQQFFNELNQLESDIMKLYAKSSTSTTAVLSAYVSGVELLFPRMTCSVMRVRNQCLYNWASPSLPLALLDQMEGLEIGPAVGSCGTAAYLKKTVIVVDVDKDPRWAPFKDVTLQAGYRACWSHAIIDSSGEVMGTFAIYYKELAGPDEQEQQIIERVVSVLAVILENRQYEEMITENSQLMAQGQELAQFGNWSWEIPDNVVSWSDTLFHIYGIDRTQFKATFEGYQGMLHPEDRDRVAHIIGSVLQNKQDVEFEERILRPDGEIRYLRSWGTLKCDEHGEPLKMIGACLDITESKKIQQANKEHLDRYNAVAKATSDTIWDYNMLTGEVTWNPNVTSMFGYEYPLGTYSWWYEHVHPEDLNRMIGLIADKVAQKEARWHSEYRFRCADGTYKFVLDRGFLIFDERGQPIRMIGSMQDVTERVEYIREIEENNARLKEIAYAQSHLVRAPLARIMSLVQLLKDAEFDTHSQSQLLSYLSQSADELDLVVRHIISNSQQVDDTNANPMFFKD